MKRILNDNRKLVNIQTSGPIVELGCLTGPVRSAKIDTNTLMLMIRNGKTIYEINPANPSETVKLTMSNVTKNNFEKVTMTNGMRETLNKFESQQNKKSNEKVTEKPVVETKVDTQIASTVSDAVNDSTPADKDEAVSETDTNSQKINNNTYYQKNKSNRNDFKKR